MSSSPLSQSTSDVTEPKQLHSVKAALKPGVRVLLLEDGKELTVRENKEKTVYFDLLLGAQTGFAVRNVQRKVPFAERLSVLQYRRRRKDLLIQGFDANYDECRQQMLDQLVASGQPYFDLSSKNSV